METTGIIGFILGFYRNYRVYIIHFEATFHRAKGQGRALGSGWNPSFSR